MSQAPVYEHFNTWELEASRQQIFFLFFFLIIMIIFQETRIN